MAHFNSTGVHRRRILDVLRRPSAPRIPGGKSFNLSDVLADIEGLRHGAGFVLFVVDGALNQLKASAYEEPWPEPAFKLGYHVGNRMEQERDRAALRKELKKLSL